MNEKSDIDNYIGCYYAYHLQLLPNPNCKRLLTMTFLFVIYTQIKYQVHCQSPTRLQLVNPLYVVFQVQLLKSL